VTEVISERSRAIANILFDEGAQHSFISQWLADMLQLTPSRQENITVAPLGADTITPYNLGVALIHVVTQTGKSIPLSVLIVPKIAAPLHTVSHVELNKLPYFHGLTLAHPVSGGKPFEISLLIMLTITGH